MVHINLNPVQVDLEYQDREPYSRAGTYRYVVSVYYIAIWKSEWQEGYPSSYEEESITTSWCNKWENFLADSFKEWSQRYGAGEEE